MFVSQPGHTSNVDNTSNRMTLIYVVFKSKGLIFLCLNEAVYLSDSKQEYVYYLRLPERCQELETHVHV